MQADYTRKNGIYCRNDKGGTRRPAFGSKRIAGPDQLVAGLSTADHFSISLFTSAASAACVRASALGMSEPRSSRRLRTFSSSSALAAAAFNLARIGAGVPFGAKIAFQAEA